MFMLINYYPTHDKIELVMLDSHINIGKQNSEVINGIKTEIILEAR